MKVWKRCLSLLLTISMVLTLLPVSVFATELEEIEAVEEAAERREVVAVEESAYEEEVSPEEIAGQEGVPAAQGSSTEIASGTCGENLTWTLTTDGTLTISGVGYMSDYETFDSAPPWFRYTEDITSVQLGDSVMSIGDFAFYDCFSLSSVKIGSSVTSIGYYAFGSCYSLSSVEIPDSVTSIGSCAFYSCPGLSRITVSAENPAYCSIDGVLFDKAVKTLIRYPGGRSAEVYTIPNSVTSIGSCAFSWCVSLSRVVIPDDVTNICAEAFLNCGSLSSVEIGHGVTSISYAAFCGCSGLTNVIIPDSVTSIGDGAFAKCVNLSSVEIPDSVTSIGDDVFSNCRRLLSVEIPDSVTNIGGSVFFGCTSLSIVKIGNSVTSIGKEAFSNCVSLASVVIPDSVTSIGGSAFFCCSSLTSVKIPDSVRSIEDFVFSYCTSLTSVEIPDSVTSIGRHAFADCDSLADLEIPNSVTSIGDSAFSCCDSLTSVEIPDSVTRIGKEAFVDCVKLTTVEIGDSVTSIGDYAFSGWNSLKTFSVSKDNRSYCSEDGILFDKGVKMLIQYPSGRPDIFYVIPDSVTSIDDYAFQNCDNLTSAVIPSSVTTIGNSAFLGCDSLSAVCFEGDAPRVYSSFPKNVTLYYTEKSSGWTDSKYYDASARTWNGYKLAIWGSAETSVTVGTGFAGNNPMISGVKWEDIWFGVPSDIYNHELARTSMVLSAAAYTDGGNMTNIWRDFGFDKFENNYPAKATKENNDFVAYSFAAKRLSGEQLGTTLIAIAVRGTPGSAEWYSNFNIGQKGSDHVGFSTAAQKLKKDLDKFIAELKAEKYSIDQNTKFLVTGHSRGAAVANLITAELTREKYSAKDNIFGYTFATPTVSTEATEEGYENIFNIINEEDFVPQVPMKKWGFTRYGVDFQLPSRSYYSSESFDSIQGKMIHEFLSITNREMFHAYSGTHAVNNLVKYILKVSPSRDAYYTQENKLMVGVKKTPCEYFSVLADFLANQSSAQTYNELIGSAQIHMDYSSITGFFITQEASNFIHYTLGGKVTDAHCPALYLSWMIGCNEEELFGKKNDKTCSTYKRATIACPVDVFVYNEAGTLVASVVNEEVVVDTLAVSVQDGVKVVDLPADQEYRVEIKAREAGTVDYSVEEKSVDGAIDTTRTVLFNDISIAKGDELVGEISAETETQTYSLTKNEKQVIQANYDLDSEGIPAIMFVAAYEDNGRMIGCYSKEIAFMGPNAEYGITKIYGDASYKVFFLDQNQKPLCGEKIIAN